MSVATRYAKALFELAREKEGVVETGDELRLIEGLLGDMPGLKTFFGGPVYELKDKKDVLEKIYTTLGLSKLTADFLLILMKKGRIRVLPDITRIYERFEDEEVGRQRVKITLPITKSETPILDKIKARLEEVTGKEVLISVEEDRSIIGGIIVQMGDIVIDGSIRSRLLKIRKSIREGV